MHKFTLVLLLFMTIASSVDMLGQVPSYRWAISEGNVGDDVGLGIAVDPIGNTYIAGFFGGDSITFGSTVLKNAGPIEPEMFLVKYDSHNNVVWAKSARGTLRDKALDVVVDPGGNTYVAGYFISPFIVFDSDTLYNKGGRDVFLAKYDTYGNVVWAKSTGGVYDDAAQKICLDGAGHCTITGYFSSDKIGFGSDTLISNSTGLWDIFIATYDTSGNVLWCRGSGGASYDIGAAVRADAGHNLYVTGYFYSSSISFGATTLTNAGSINTFLVKYDQLGNLIWARSSSGSPNMDAPYSIAVSPSGISTLAAYSTDFSLVLGTDTLVSENPGNIFAYAVQYDSSGNVRWATGSKGVGSRADALAVAMDANGNTYLGGRYFGGASVVFDSETLTNGGDTDMYVVKFDSAGNVLWAVGAGSSGSDQIWGMTADSGGNVFITGEYTSPTLSLGPFTFSNAGGWDVISAMISEASVTVQKTISVRNRWNMISVPVSVPDYGKTILFPTAVSNAFSYQGGYTSQPTLNNRIGYWVAFNGAQDLAMIGIPRTKDSIDVAVGWNLIGSISSPVPVATIGSIPGGIVTSQFFGFDGTYLQRDTIRPGEGYWVKVDQAGKLVLSSEGEIVPLATRTRICRTNELPPPSPEESASDLLVPIPKEFGLHQNYPNPFNPSTTIKFQIPLAGYAILRVYNTMGEEVAALVDGMQEAGYKSVNWDARNVPSGVYFYRLTARNFSETRKLMVIK